MKNRARSPRSTGFAVLTLSVIIFASPLLANGASTAVDSLSSYGTNWESEPRADIAAFNGWAAAYVQRGNRRSLAEGLRLARQRHAALSDLIRSHPEQAIASAVPVAIRKQLPAEISYLLEVPVSGLGNFSVFGALGYRDGPAVEPVTRFVQFGDKTYRAYVYGRRLGETTKKDIPLHGIVLDGAIALHEAALRPLGSDETPDPAKPIIDLSASPARPATPLVLTLAEAGNRIYRFASPKQFLHAEAELEKAESAIGPQLLQSADRVLEEFGRSGLESESISPTPDSAWTQGNKKVLVIRVDFRDLPGDPHYRYGNPYYTAATVQNIANAQINPFYAHSSYGLTSLTTTVTTQVYRMPYIAQYYAIHGLNDQLHADARIAAAANYTLANYQRIVVLFSYLGNFPGSRITYRGLGVIGGSNVWLNGSFDFNTVAHELGHTYGLFHANLWVGVNDDPIALGGYSAEYGDQFDIMGDSGDARCDFNPWFKNRLGWIGTSKIKTITASGTYRINRFDNNTGAGILALKVVKDGTRNYWIGCRRKFTNNFWMQHGAYITWGYNAARQSDLLDMTTSTDIQDAALAIGRTFVDPAAHVSIRPVAGGGVAPNEYVDVQVNVLPSNDFFVDAQLLSGRVGSTGKNSITATKELGEPSHAGNNGGKSLWYRWVAPANGVANFNTFGSNFDTLLAVYRGGFDTGLNGLQPERGSDDASNSTLQSAVTFNAWAGITYFVAVDGHNGAGGNITLNWSFTSKADFNGDGTSDILWQDNLTGERLIWLMHGEVHTGSTSLQAVPTTWDIAGSGDFNGDGKPDILWQNGSSGERVVWLMNGTAHTGNAFLQAVPTVWNIAGSGDFNGDGKPDILWQNSLGGQRLIWLMNGTAHTGNAELPTMPTVWDITGCGDFNGDGKPDILWQNRSTGQPAVWMMNGTVLTSSVTMASMSTEWNIGGTGDFSGDGKSDILWQNSSTGQRVFWRMDGMVYQGGVTLETLPVEWDIRNH